MQFEFQLGLDQAILDGILMPPRLKTDPALILLQIVPERTPGRQPARWYPRTHGLALAIPSRLVLADGICNNPLLASGIHRRDPADGCRRAGNAVRELTPRFII